MTLRRSLFVVAVVAAWWEIASPAKAQPRNDDAADVAAMDPLLPAPGPVSVPLKEERILKLIPDFQTVTDTSRPVAPLSAAEKWKLGWKEAADPFNIVNAAMTAAFSQHENQTPRYGEGWPNYGRRFGAAVADFGTQSLFSAGIFATLLHQDPRYFRKGSGTGVVKRALYAGSRLFVCRNDAGRSVFNSSNLLGMGLGIAASNLYYPAASRDGMVMAGRIETSLLGGLTGNLLSEFWPDLQRILFHRRAKV
ncbi:MAG: hypothetical protein KGN36_17520 [Acidobacteriota bacterium]|nr:hypothetical protein [Acidobacteriota bacterium]